MMDSQETKKIYTSKEEVVNRAKEIVNNEENVSREELDVLKTVFYKLLIAEKDEQQKAYLEAGGDLESYVVTADPMEEEFKGIMAQVREQRAAIFQKQEEERKANLEKKLEIIEKIKNMATSPDEANNSYNEFKVLHNEWKEIGAVPPENATEVWRNYQHAVEQYYDLLKLNFEARDYDFKKNLEKKLAICEKAEALAKEDDVVSAFHQLQGLHDEYREIGPVSKELREEVWARFKAASTAINKAHQTYFENLRAAEEENLIKKTALCEKVEAIADMPKKGNADWEDQSKKMIEVQAEWKTIGFAPHKMNVKIFERFRAACDKFFTAKGEYYKNLKDAYAENISKKEAIVAKAKELAESKEWRNAGEKLIALQAEWKEIGAVPHKVGNQLWTEFRAACDKFFEARHAATAGVRGEEKANLEKKRDIVSQLKALAENAAEGLNDKVKALQDEYNQVGHVPFKEKDALYKEYREVLDVIYAKIRKSAGDRRLAGFKASIAKKGEGANVSERSRLMRSYDILCQEIKTYENNLCFLSTSSKKGNALVDEITRKVEKLKAEVELTKEKIKAIDAASKA